MQATLWRQICGDQHENWKSATGNDYRMMKKLADEMYDIAVNTFELTCYMFPLEEREVEELGINSPDGRLQSLILFDGSAKGGLRIHPSRMLLRAIAANMLGIEEADENQQMGGLCEIANIICGNILPLLTRRAGDCKLLPPGIVGAQMDLNRNFTGMQVEEVSIYLDQGMADISLFYSITRNQ